MMWMGWGQEVLEGGVESSVFLWRLGQKDEGEVVVVVVVLRDGKTVSGKVRMRCRCGEEEEEEEEEEMAIVVALKEE